MVRAVGVNLKSPLPASLLDGTVLDVPVFFDLPVDVLSMVAGAGEHGGFAGSNHQAAW